MGFGSVTNVMREKDLLGGCLDLIDCRLKVVVISKRSYQNIEFEDDGSIEIAKKRGAYVLMVDTADQAEMRNAGIKWLSDNGAEYAFIIDADEWWTKNAMSKVKKFIEENPSDGYTVKMKDLFRKPNWYTECEVDGGTPVCIRTDRTISSPRRFSFNSEHIEDSGDVFHFSYCRTPEKVKEKIVNFSHASEVKDGWYEKVFLPCTINSKDLHPTNPHIWPSLREIKLPKEIKEKLLKKWFQ